MLRIGDLAPDFELPDQDAGPVRLSECLAHGPLLLYFYPADFTPVCTREACGYRELQPQLEHRGVAIIGISPQDSASHARFRLHHGLPFPLLSDPDKRVIRAYGCDGPLGIGVRRVSYLIGTNGRVQARVHAAFRVSRHLELARELLEKR
ncbi:MAG: peroxiredoxin [Gammaproteobacteria bacterium]